MFRIMVQTMTPLNRLGSATLLAVACLTIMVGCVIVPGLTRISQALGVPELASWLVTLPSLGVVLFGPLAAKLLGRIGLRNGLRVGLIAYGVLGAGGMFLHREWLLLTDRLLLGGATALIMASGTGLISHFYSGKQRLSMIARQGMSIELGGVIFLFIGGLLASAGWQYPFLLYLFAWLLWGCVELTVPAEPRERPTPDDAKRNLRISRPLWLVYVAATLSMLSFFAAVISLPRHLQPLGMSEAQVGYFLSFVSLVAVGAAALMPKVSSRFGEVGTLVRAFVFYGIAHLLFYVGDTVGLYILGGVALGIGFGLSVPLVNHMTVEQSHEIDRGPLLAYLSMAIFLGQFLSSLLEFVPGDGKAVFMAAVIAVLASVTLARWHRALRA